MEGIEQLFVLAAVFVLALIDLLVRWRKKKPAEGDERAGAGVDGEEPVFVEDDESERLDREWVESPQPPVPTSRASTPPAQPTLPPERPTGRPTTISERRQPRARHWLAQPMDARRGIVLMAILGPCRGLEPPSDTQRSVQR